MWTSRQARAMGQAEQSCADLGVVTVSGQENGVYLGTERRWLPVMGPGGYQWRPRVGEQVLVLKTGTDGELGCIVARQDENDGQLLPGEVQISTQDCSIKLTAAGGVEITGAVSINGQSLQALIRDELAAHQEG